MATLSDLKKRLLSLKGKELTLASEAIQENDEKILSLNRQQLFDGKKSDGSDLSPTYLNDPYFKTREAAQRYSDWKDKITPNSKRKKGVPNLFINGYFHNSIEVDIDKKGLSFSSNELGIDIVPKFGGDIFGLNSESRVELNKTVEPLFISKVRKFLKL
jgi:hypothetical protein